MSDSEDGHFFWESLISPGKRRRKRNEQKEKKCVKPKSPTGKTDKTKKTKKKTKKKKTKRNSGFKEAMGEWKEKKKEKKVKKPSVGLPDSLLCTQGGACAEPKSPRPLSTAHETTENAKRKSKRQKVAFASSSGPRAVKRPKFASPLPKESIIPQRGGGDCSQGAVPSRAHDNDSQCTSDDLNSQDLFITQKTFRTSPVETSSGEACDANPRLHESAAQRRPEARQQQTPVLLRSLLKEEEEEEPSLTGSNKNLTKVKKASRSRHVRFCGVTPLLDDPVSVKTPTKTPPCTSGRSSCLRTPPEPPPLPPKSNTSTQTENFFTTELSSFLNFRQRGRGAVCSEDSKPLDLSLQRRARNTPGTCASGERASPPPEKTSSNGHGDAGLAPPPLPPPPSSDTEQTKVKTTPSPESESDVKSADTTTSSEDNEPTCCAGKLGMTQVRAVQTRLNESFFFKSKGDRRSRRPESPLMKLAQGRETKSRKGH